MKRRSIQAELVRAVLLLEVLSLCCFIALAVFHESKTRFRAFDQMLDSRTATVFGAVEDADDVSDNIMLETHGLHLPAHDYFDVWDARGRLLGRSRSWPEALDEVVPRSSADGRYTVRLKHGTYQFVVLHAVRMIDPATAGGGTPRAVTVRYGAAVAPVWHEVWEAVCFYAVASLLLLAATALVMTWLLRRGFVPVRELADEAGRISVQQWQFRPSMAARRIVELAPLAEALELTLARLRRSFEQQRRLTSDAAHELKTDLAIAKSSLQLLAMRPRSGKDYREGLERCQEDTERVETTVRKMLLLAQVEHAAGRQAATAELVCDASLCLRASERQLAALAELQGITLQVDAPPVAPIRMRGEDFQLVCTNLMLNALQHSRSGAAVRVRIHFENAEMMTVSVSDEGAGIPAHALPHIFEPFFRSDEARDRKSGGTGLGLAICKGLVETNGGLIDISSEVDRGTKVSVRLALLHSA